MNNDIYSFYELLQTYKVQILIIQRDYAQGRKKNLGICKNFLKTLKESIINLANQGKTGQNVTISIVFVCHGIILKNPEKACKINDFMV